MQVLWHAIDERFFDGRVLIIAHSEQKKKKQILNLLH